MCQSCCMDRRQRSQIVLFSGTELCNLSCVLMLIHKFKNCAFLIGKFDKIEFGSLCIGPNSPLWIVLMPACQRQNSYNTHIAEFIIVERKYDPRDFFIYFGGGRINHFGPREERSGIRHPRLTRLPRRNLNYEKAAEQPLEP